MKCKKCKSLLITCGFERKLITRGKDKGLSYVRDLYKCPGCEKHLKSSDKSINLLLYDIKF